MKLDDPSDAAETDEQFNAGSFAAPLDESPLLSIREARLDRALDYQLEALRKEDRLEACVAALNGGLIRFACHLEEALEQAITKGPATTDVVLQLGPPTDVYLRVVRQVDRFAQWDVRSREARRKAKDIQTTALPATTKSPSEEMKN